MSDTKYEPLQEGEQLFLRGCGPSGEAYGGFVWPLEVGAVVTAPDWNPEPVCGGGLHGNLWGGGNADVLVAGGVGLVVAARDAVDLGGKHKFAACRVVYVGATLRDAATWLAKHPALPAGSAVHYGTSTSGYRGTSTSGDHGTSTSGDEGTSTSGYRGTSTSGDHGTAAAGVGGCVAVRRPDGSLCAREIDGLKYLPGVKYRYDKEKKDLVPA